MNIQESFASFVAQRPKWFRYETRENLNKIQALAVTITPDLSTTTCWCRAFDKLVANGTLIPKPNYVPPAVPVSPEFRLRVQQMHNDELRSLYRTDPAFREQLDRLWSEEGTSSREIPVPEAGEYADFRAADWHKVPPDVLARLMSKPAFRKRVDELIAEGTI